MYDEYIVVAGAQDDPENWIKHYSNYDTAVGDYLEIVSGALYDQLPVGWGIYLFKNDVLIASTIANLFKREMEH